MLLRSPTISRPDRRRELIRGEGKPHPGRRMTEAEFAAWVDEWTRAEWVDGEVIVMAAQNDEHADLLLWAASIMRAFVEERDLGIVRGPDYVVRLRRQRRRRAPDLVFLAKGREKLLRDTYVEGAPDLIVEVVSPDSIARDWREKYGEYEKAGVREYWIIDPLGRVVEGYQLDRPAKKYRPLPQREGRITSRVLPGFFLKAEWLFAARRPRLIAVQRELGLE